MRFFFFMVIAAEAGIQLSGFRLLWVLAVPSLVADDYA
jgi:hypothetical protein